MSWTVAVRALCEFTAREGDLDRRFTPAPSAQQGIEGHGVVTARRAAGYETEITLQTVHGELTVRGRADGFDPRRNRLEEIKTHRGDLAAMPANQRALHWAQAKVYGHLLCLARELAQIDIALVYFDIGSQRETALVQTFAAIELSTFFALQCDRYIAWAQQEGAHRAARDAALRELGFPHGDFRPGQRTLAEAVYRGARDGHCVLAEAPTGIGKTIGTLYPVLKACPGQGLDKVFFLAAKAPGRQLALDGVQRISEASAGAALPLRTLDMVARDKMCVHPDKACHGDDCPLARGFYDRLPAARAAAVQAGGILDAPRVKAVAQAHDVCPYYLSQELAKWSDVVVADYNYFFDASAMLYALTLSNLWRVTVLVDEAHNMISRARGMYSASLDQADMDAARHAAPAVLRKPLDTLAKRWRAWNKTVDAGEQAVDQPPEAVCEALQHWISATTDALDASPEVDGPVMRFYFDALQFIRLTESFGAHSLFDVTTAQVAGRTKTLLSIRNVVPAPFLAPRYAAARTVSLFSGTLNPMHYYADMLGLPATTVQVEVASPFHAGQLAVNVVDDVSTRFKDRAASVDRIVAVMARQYAARPGNYLAFFSSFDYLVQVLTRYTMQHGDTPVWAQSAGMSEAARAAFLARFEAGGRGIGFAVLGGAFGEGVDLPGDRLVGAFIATLGLPQINAVNERMMQCMTERFGNGYDYTYLYPGLQKVVQAAGRVIRTETDEGVIHLIDDRYGWSKVRALLPGWWRPVRRRAA